jgi:putative transposase
MPQSLAKIYVHLVFSTKHREPCLLDELKTDLHAYIGGTLNGLGSMPVEINSEPDHLHALFLLSRTTPLSEIIGTLKTSSNNWLRGKGAHLAQFHWQGGYGAFSVSHSGVKEVRAYIRDQKEHHKRISFQDEFRAFFRRYEVEHDEKYMWD